jgi:deoxyhypusine synthase
MLYFHTLKRTLQNDNIPRHISLDIIPDIVAINTIALRAHCSGVIILGGGLIKHHICNANLMRNGADFAVYINTSAEFDGSDAGANPEEAISWGKIRAGAQSVKVNLTTSDIALILGLLRCDYCISFDCG